MSCEEIDELLAGHVLEALGDEEEAEVRRHVVTCRRHDAALAELRAAAERLPLAVEEREPSSELKTRLLERFDAEAAGPATPVAAPEPLPRPLFSRPAFGLAIAAALLLAVGLSAWSLALQLGPDGADSIERAFVGEGGGGELIYLEDDQIAVLALALPEPSADRVYQAWAIFEQGPTSLGLVPHDGVTAVTHDLSDAHVVAVTEEPPGGSDQPTSDPALVASLE